MTDNDVLRDIVLQHNRLRSWRKLGEAIGRSGAYMMRLTWGLSPFEDKRARAIRLTPEVRSKWLQWRGQVRTYTAFSCPSCGGAHYVDDCHGNSGTTVYLVRGERIVKRGRRRAVTHIAELPVSELRRRIRMREEMQS